MLLALSSNGTVVTTASTKELGELVPVISQLAGTDRGITLRHYSVWLLPRPGEGVSYSIHSQKLSACLLR